MTDNRTAMELHVLRRDNAELKRLVADMWRTMESDTYAYDPEERMFVRKRMRKLGITEVDHEG